MIFLKKDPLAIITLVIMAMGIIAISTTTNTMARIKILEFLMLFLQSKTSSYRLQEYDDSETIGRTENIKYFPKLSQVK